MHSIVVAFIFFYPISNLTFDLKIRAKVGKFHQFDSLTLETSSITGVIKGTESIAWNLLDLIDIFRKTTLKSYEVRLIKQRKN